MSAFDHQRIRDEQDRSFTTALIEAVRDLDPNETEWAEALASVRWLADYRSVSPLRRFVQDQGRPIAARNEIGLTLSSFDLTTTSSERVAWWKSGDEVMRALAMRLMERSEAEIVLPTAIDPDHPLQALAVATLEWGFEEPEYQGAKVAALASARADVREAAIYTVSWDEPLAAEPDLRHLLSDEDSEIARAAAYALQYFPSLATLDHLRAHRGQNSAEFERQKAESIDFIEGSIEAELAQCDARQREALARWVDAIDLQLDQADPYSDSDGQQKPPVPQPRLDPSADPEEFDDALDTTSGSFVGKIDRLRSINWEEVPADARSAIAERLVEHPDPEIRVLATRSLARWNDGDRLAALLDDEHATVRKCAMYSLGRVEPEHRFASLSRDRLASAAGTAASETLTTFARHAEPVERDALLFDLAVASHQFSLRTAAVQLLAEAGAERRLKRVIRLLDVPPWTNWAYHIALLDTDAVSTANPSRVADLVEVDNIHMAASAARAADAMNRND